MGEFLGAYGWWIGGVLLLAFAAVVFRLNLARYERITGYCFEVAGLRTLLVVGAFAGAAALAWWLPGLVFVPGRGLDLARFLLFGFFEATLAAGAVALGTLLIEKKYHL